MDRPSVAEVIAAILLPPLGIFLSRGLGVEFWIGVVLTILFWLPGIIYAVAVVVRPDLFARA